MGSGEPGGWGAWESDGAVDPGVSRWTRLGELEWTSLAELGWTSLPELKGPPGDQGWTSLGRTRVDLIPRAVTEEWERCDGEIEGVRRSSSSGGRRPTLSWPRSRIRWDQAATILTEGDGTQAIAMTCGIDTPQDTGAIESREAGCRWTPKNAPCIGPC